MTKSVSLLELQMEELVRSIMLRLNLTHVPDPMKVARELGLTLSYSALEASSDGMFLSDRKHIIVNDNVWNEDRKRFTAFHEICHHLIEEDEDLLSEIHELFTGNDDIERFIERLCDVGAAEFLLPKNEIYQVIAESGFSISFIDLISHEYKVSKLATTFRLAECAEHKCILAVCKVEEGEIIIENTFSSRSLKYSLRKGQSISGEHPLCRFVHNIEKDKLFEINHSYIPFASGARMECHIEGIIIKNRIYISFNHTLPVNSDQLLLF